jgi:hypothetical protein
MWKMKMKFLLCEKYLWEITLGELLPLEVEFGKIIFEGSNFEYCLIIKKDKLVHQTILLNVVGFLLHHVAHAKTIKKCMG